MITLLSEIHFWTTQEDIIIKSTDYGSYKYYIKKEGGDSLYGQSKKLYSENRGIYWNLPNKRPQKLRERMKEFEDHLVHNRVVSFNWEECSLKILLSTGMLVTIQLNSKTGDPSNITFDKQFSAKLQVNIICDGTIFGNQVICICNDGHVLGYGGQWKDGWVLEGGPRRKLNYHGDWLAVWGKAGAEHPQPWSPLAKDHQRANLHLYWIGSRDPELLSYKKTDGEPLQVVVSKFKNRNLILIEQRVTQRGSVSVEVSNFELVGNNLKRVSVTSVPLQTQVSCSALSYLEDRLLICCIDGSLALLDRNRGSTRTVKASFIPTMASWHPDGAVIAISNEKGQLQYFDTSLNCLRSQFLNEDCSPTLIINLSSYFTTQFSVASINWGPKDLMISFEQGPIAVVTHTDKSLSFKAIVQNYLTLGKVDEAIKLLLSWEFKEDSFFALQKIVAYLMRQPLTEEVAQHLQNALGSYHNSPVPLKPQIRHRYGNQVISLTRRFFHQLVRAEMFETAFLLAVDVSHHDLFMDLHYIAVKIGETEMAAAARAQASSLLSRCSSEASNCSRSSCSQCSDSGSSSSENDSNSENLKESSKVATTRSYVPPLPLNPDNCLATDFNQPDPTTYKPFAEKPISSLKYQSEYSRSGYGSRATYVKAPQVPCTFTKTNVTISPSLVPPPLPYTQPLPTSLGIPYSQVSTSFGDNSQTPLSSVIGSSFSLNGNFFSGTTSSTSFMTNSTTSSDKTFQNSLATSFNSSGLSVNNVKRNFASSKILSPPLPDLTMNTSNSDLINFSSTHVHSAAKPPPYSQSNTSTSENTSTSGSKKHQPKVKFSDTVTAFIVPEIKRPQRPLPPAHVTDPQKELADSLPLCHPNEDYLKDFTPVRKEDDTEGSDNGQQPKIKVVHFGVV
nr:WD repeat-containing and planar cell polarity effector protein fritz [Leptinotarsa decemlineata]